jgi:hypothetical protein
MSFAVNIGGLLDDNLGRNGYVHFQGILGYSPRAWLDPGICALSKIRRPVRNARRAISPIGQVPTFLQLFAGLRDQALELEMLLVHQNSETVFIISATIIVNE